MNSSEWDKFRKQQGAEREQLQCLLSGIQPLLAKCRDAIPTGIELSALAATLHSFYTGVENIFKRVAVELDGKPALRAWVPDYMRHTAISNHFAHNKHEGETASWAGNSPNVIHRHYKALVKEADAKEFWEIAPDNVGQRIPFPATSVAVAR